MPEYTENNDCIRRSAAMDLVDLYWQQAYNAHYSDAALRLGSLYLDMEDIPAADVRPVVLCRDCIHCKKGKASLECEKHTYSWNNMRRWVDEDDFCKWGVKREES